LFVKALLALEGDSCLEGVEEIVFLGQNGHHLYGDAKTAATLLTQALSLKVNIISDLDSREAQDYLRSHAEDSLVTVPSRSETMGFTAIEASLITGLNLICANAGGIPEIFGKNGIDQLFEPTVNSVTDSLKQWLECGPRSDEGLCHYDWQSANQ